MLIFEYIINKELEKDVKKKLDALEVFSNTPTFLSPPPSPAKQSSTSMYSNSFGAIVDIEDSLLPSCINNYAVCALYIRKANLAITKLEELILENPVKYMIDPIIFNLCMNIYILILYFYFLLLIYIIFVYFIRYSI
jgi:hypothetical protein